MSFGFDRANLRVLQRIGADALFTGTAGDHLFYDRVPVVALADFVRDGRGLHRWPQVASTLAHDSRETVWSAVSASAAALTRRPPTARELVSFRNPFVPTDLRNGDDRDAALHPWFSLGLLELPPAKRQQVAYLMELQRHYFRYGRGDLVDEVHPLFSQPLMEACLRTPAYWFAAPGVRRGMARRVFADIVPASILQRRTKGGTSAHWIQALQNDFPAHRTRLLEGELVKRGFLDRSRLEAALTSNRLAIDREFAYLAISLATEMWIQQALRDETPEEYVKARARALSPSRAPASIA